MQMTRQYSLSSGEYTHSEHIVRRLLTISSWRSNKHGKKCDFGWELGDYSWIPRACAIFYEEDLKFHKIKKTNWKNEKN